MASRAPIERLPVELIVSIFEHLSLPHRQALRLASRQLHAFTLSTFSKDHYSRQPTTLGSPSLERLLQISSRRYLADSVFLLDVRLFNLEEYRTLQEISRTGIYPPPKRLAQVHHIKRENASKEAALFDYMRTCEEPKEVIDKLGRALRRFPALQAVRIRVNGVALHEKYSQTHEDEDEDEYIGFLIPCFRAVTTALIKSKTRIEEFSLVRSNNLSPFSSSANLVYPAFHFPVPYLLSLGEVFSRLRTLTLSICTKRSRNMRERGRHDTVSQFIATAPALEELSLCFQPGDQEPQYRAAIMHSIARSIEFPKLKELQLYRCAVDEQDLTTFTKAHSATIHRIIIGDAVLQQGTWSSVLNSFRETLGLQFLRLTYLQQSSSPRVVYLTLPGGTRRRLSTTMKAASGHHPSMEEMLAEAVDYLSNYKSDENDE